MTIIRDRLIAEPPDDPLVTKVRIQAMSYHFLNLLFKKCFVYILLFHVMLTFLVFFKPDLFF